MSSVGAGWCYGIFLDAYTYSTNYLLFSITIIIASILFLWIYEKPQFYKLIFKRSKHSVIVSSTQSEEALENYNASLLDHETTNNQEEKKTIQLPDSESCH
ncbi:unnamed protein product [Chrysodeixis includens]|uniref:Uncharacterized protein n=1 Tax=Chrysodeixis includens TaxID=689277 RepID=A0A9P0FU84_CHRIL|nr:unnamed protein product [Chrysodeixis includens]